jgi:integrase
MMVFRRQGRTVYVLEIPTRTGSWVERTTGTRDRATAREMERAVTTLAEKRAWDVLRRITDTPSTLDVPRLYDLWRECAADLTLLRARLDDIDLAALVPEWERYLRSAKRDVAPDTADHYVSAVRGLIPDGASLLRSHWTADLLEEHFASMECSSSTVRKRGAGIRDFDAWLVMKKVLARPVAALVSLPAQAAPRDRWLTPEQVCALADAKPEPYRTLDYLLAGSAADLTSALEITRADVDLVSPVVTVRVRGTKTHNRDRRVVLSSYCVPAIRAACAGLMPTAVLVPGVNRWTASDVNRATCSRLGGDFTGYWLRDHRHTWAVRMAKTGAPLQLIAEGLGNTLQMIEKVYSPYRPTSQERAAWERIADAQDRAAVTG